MFDGGKCMPIDTERLSLKILQTDKLALRSLAQAEGEPMSVVIRRILRNELKQKGLLDSNPIRKERINGTLTSE